MLSQIAAFQFLVLFVNDESDDTAAGSLISETEVCVARISPASRNSHGQFSTLSAKIFLRVRDDWKLLSPSHLSALNQQHTLHNTRSIKVHDGFRFHVGIFDRDDRLIHPILCCTDGAVRKLMVPVRATKVATPGHTRRSAESVPAVQVFPLQLVTLDLSLSPASLQLVILELSLMPASLTSRSTRSIPALPSNPYITQANMKICSHSPHLSKDPSLQWNCCASPLPPPHPTTPSLRMADTIVGFSMVPNDPGKCEAFRCSFNSIKPKACFADSLMRVNSMSRHKMFVGQLQKIVGIKDDCVFCARTLRLSTELEQPGQPENHARSPLQTDQEPRPAAATDSALEATSTIHANSAGLQPSAPPPCVELVPAQVNSSCAVDRHGQLLLGVRDVLFPRSCCLTRNRFLSLVRWLYDTLKITVGYKCTCVDDTRTTTTTEIVHLQTDTHEMSAKSKNEKIEKIQNIFI